MSLSRKTCLDFITGCSLLATILVVSGQWSLYCRHVSNNIHLSYKLNLQDWVKRIAVNNWILFQRSVKLFFVVTVRCSQLTFQRYLYHCQTIGQNTCISLILEQTRLLAYSYTNNSYTNNIL